MDIRDVYLLERSEQFEINSDEEVTIDLSLHRAVVCPQTILSGKVVECYNPISGATVKVFDKKYKPLFHTTTDSSGEFIFKNILTPGEYIVIATASGYQVSREYYVFLKPFITTHLFISLNIDCNAYLGTVYGRVFDEKGNVINDAEICIKGEACVKATNVITSTNSDGEYLVYGLSSGEYSMVASKQGFLSHYTTLNVAAFEIINIDLNLIKQLDGDNGTVSGVIYDNKKAVAYALVALYKVENNTEILLEIKKANNLGVYLFPNVKPGKYIIKSKLEDSLYLKNCLIIE